MEAGGRRAMVFFDPLRTRLSRSGWRYARNAEIITGPTN